MFAFRDWHSALEMKLYLQRFIHHIGGLPDLSALMFTKYNQYESLILPMVKYLEAKGVQFQYDTMVTNVIFDIKNGKKLAEKIVCQRSGKEESIKLTKNDLVFITNGSCTENSTLGDQNHAPEFNGTISGCWQLWRNIARQDPAFGNPDKFCTNTKETNWESATITTLDSKIPKYIEKICKRDPFSGKVVTGGIITVKDSNWLMSYTLNRQPHMACSRKFQGTTSRNQ
jgi:oleate hydratase